MTARDVLLAAKEGREEIENILRRREKYLDMAVRISGKSESGIRSQSNRSRVEEAALRLVSIADELSRTAEKYAEDVMRAEDLIRKIKKPRYRQVLELRYLSGESWRTVADIMNYSDVKSAFRVHGWALYEAERILKCGYNTTS